MNGLLLKESGESKLIALSKSDNKVTKIRLPKLSKICMPTNNTDPTVHIEHDEFNYVTTICLLPDFEKYDSDFDLQIYASDGVEEVYMASSSTADELNDNNYIRCSSNGTSANNYNNMYAWNRWADETYTNRQDSITVHWIAKVSAHTMNHSVTLSVPPPPTPEQVQQRLEEAEKARVEAKRQKDMRELAEKRALELLLNNLDSNQKEVFEKTGAIPIKGSSGGIYQIDKHGSISELDKSGKKIKSICIHTTMYLPTHDEMLAKKLMFEICEDEARKIGHFSNYLS